VLQFFPGSLGSSSIQFNGGTLQFTSGYPADISASILPLTSTAFIDTNSNAITTFASPISGINPLAGLNKITGAGTLVLSAVNTYQGATTVSAGSIELNNVNAIANSTLTINVDNGATFSPSISSFNVGGLAGANYLALQNTLGTPINLNAGGNNANTTYSGSISGTGSLTNSGTGTLTLSGTNSFSGGLTLNGGSLSFANGSLGSGPITFAANATLQWSVPSTATTDNTQDISGQIQPIPAGVTASLDPQNATITLSHAISGSGAINKVNSGTLVLTAANNYSGGTTISGGYLQIGNAGTGDSTTGSIVGNVTDNGTLVFDHTDNVNFTGSITGTGSIINQNAIIAGNVGTLTLSNSANNIGGYLEPNSPITVAANMTVGQISGASTLNISAGKLTVSPQFLLQNINDLNISAGAQLDLTNNSIYIHDTTQLASIVSLLTSGFNKGAWKGSGIMTSTSSMHNYYTTLGYGIVNLGTTSSPNNVIYVKYTLPGDTNLDGTVNNTDLNNMVPASSGGTWATGDFNYDGQVNADDYSLFQLGAALGTINPSLAPEPSVLALGALAIPMFIRRRKS
jgi:autotransporter-associated beta strand protein